VHRCVHGVCSTGTLVFAPGSHRPPPWELVRNALLCHRVSPFRNWQTCRLFGLLFLILCQSLFWSAPRVSISKIGSTNGCGVGDNKNKNNNHHPPRSSSCSSHRQALDTYSSPLNTLFPSQLDTAALSAIQPPSSWKSLHHPLLRQEVRDEDRTKDWNE